MVNSPLGPYVLSIQSGLLELSTSSVALRRVSVPANYGASMRGDRGVAERTAGLAQTTRQPVACRHCSSPLTRTFVDLGMSPLCESFLTRDQLDEPETYYPLHARVCDACLLVQLPEFVSPAHIFSEYAYFSSYSTSWVEHAKRYCQMIAERLSLGTYSFVVELASNDGYLLQHFLSIDVPVLGVEPAANVAEAARAVGVPTLISFFGVETARRIIAEYGHADLIVANNVLAQVPDIKDFVAGIAELLAPQGVVTIEVPHIGRLIAENQFDTIYHEHMSYFSLGTVGRIAKEHGLDPIDVEMLPTHGGSLRIYLAHQEAAHPVSVRVGQVLAHERRTGLDNVNSYADFSEQVRRVKHELLSVLIAAKADGKRICGYGAPGKGNTLLNYCGIGTDFVDFTVDRNSYKHGRYTPGMRIPILPVDAIDRARARLHHHSSLELEARDRAADGPCGRLGRQVYRSHPHGRRVRAFRPRDGQSKGLAMKVVLFCGGLGTRIREYFESVPKPMIPIGHAADPSAPDEVLQQYGHSRFRALPRLQGQRHQGFLPQLSPADLRRLRGLAAPAKVDMLDAADDDWRVALIDTGRVA